MSTWPKDHGGRSAGWTMHSDGNGSGGSADDASDADGNDRPGTGRTLATYATMPLHENIIVGADTVELSSGYFGSAARWLETEWGGTVVVGPGTLGDQVAPTQNDTIGSFPAVSGVPI